MLALAVALMLGFGRRTGRLEQWPNARPLAFLGQISYSLFLVHFPVLLLANVLYAKLEMSSPSSAIFGLILALAASTGAATLFYRWIESPAASQRITAMFGWLSGSVWMLARRTGRLARRAITLGRA
jgi:peptidoglycan/LPS O-acetylase OafA/YrhL